MFRFCQLWRPDPFCGHYEDSCKTPTLYDRSITKQRSRQCPLNRESRLRYPEPKLKDPFFRFKRKFSINLTSTLLIFLTSCFLPLASCLLLVKEVVLHFLPSNFYPLSSIFFKGWLSCYLPNTPKTEIAALRSRWQRMKNVILKRNRRIRFFDLRGRSSSI
jgi:hypothetical protein